MTILKSMKMMGAIAAIIGGLTTVNKIQAMESRNPVSQVDPGYNLFPEIKKVNDNFYVGKMKGRDLWMVMERVHEWNVLDWQNYAKVQSNGHVVNYSANFMKNFNSDGVAHFAKVLNTVSFDTSSPWEVHKLWIDNEVWVAYVTGDAHPMPIEKSKMFNYTTENVLDQKIAFAKNLYMYVTITTSPKALITSHMGVSASAEGLAKGVRGISMDLHSFAGKVMLMRNTDRKYMINAPASAMEKIIIQGLPANSVFAGTKEMAVKVEERLKFNEEEVREGFKREVEDIKDKLFHGGNLSEWSYKIVQKPWDLSKLESKVRELKQKLQEKEIEESEFKEKFNDLMVGERNFDIGKAYGKDLTSWYNPYSFDGWQAEESKGFKGIENMNKLFEEHPPLLSVDGERGKWIKNSCTVFDKKNPNQPWLTITKGDPNYDWMFTETFGPAGVTHYIVVDLEALAKAKALDPLK